MTAPRHSQRFTAARGLALVVLLIPSATVYAQQTQAQKTQAQNTQAQNTQAQKNRRVAPSDPSHRQLRLPPAGPEDMLQQFRMMQQLRDLIDRQARPRALPDDLDLSELAEGLDDNQLDAFRDLMRLLPQGVDLQQLGQGRDAERMQDALRNPQIRQMLEQFQRDRNFPFRGESPGGRGPTAPDVAPQDPAVPSTSDGSPSLRPAPSSPQRRPATAANPPASTEIPATRNGANANADRAASRPRRSPVPEAPRRAFPPSSAGRRDSDFPSRKMELPRSTSLTSLPEYLQQVQRDPSILPEFDEVLPTAPRLNVDSERAAANEQIKQTLKSLMPERVADKLERTGFRKTLGDLVAEASQDARRQQLEAIPSEISAAAASESSMLSGVETGLLKALDGVKDSVVDLATEYASKSKKPKRKPGSPSSSSANNSAVAQSTPAKSKASTATSLAKSTSSFWSKLTSAPASSVSAVSEASQRGVAAAGDGGRGYRWLLALAFCGCLFWLVRRRLGLSHRHRAAAELPELGDIHCGADVVRAFHVLAARSHVPTEVWWTHRRAAAAWSHAQPAFDASCATLVQLYEQVRYAPADQPLSPEQLAAARRAVRQCRA